MVVMRTLAYHERVPGHHFQIALQQEMTDLPQYRARRIFSGGSANSEGWAVYVEQLAMEQGWYEGDTVGMLRILELREQARSALGVRVTLPAFHDVVLGAGSVPMDVLALIVGQSIADTRQVDAGVGRASTSISISAQAAP